MSDPVLWALVAAAAVVALGAASLGGWYLNVRQRAAHRRQREMAVREELEGLGVEEVAVHLQGSGSQGHQELGWARLARRAEVLARRGTGFFLVPLGTRRWPGATGSRVLLRFEQDGVRHELRCRVVGQGRLTARGRRRLAVDRRTVYRVVPAGVIVKRERRDMMRFYVGDARSAPGGTTDARRFVELRAWLQATDLDLTGSQRLRLRLRADAFSTLDGDPSPAGASVAGLPVDVLDFSGSGLRIETGLATVAALLQLGDDEVPEDLLDRLAERAMLATVEVRFQFPSKAADLEPAVAPRLWLLVEMARVALLEGDGAAGETRIRLGLAFLYQVLDLDADTGRPRRWQLLRGRSEADDFVAIHSALNQAAARLQADARL